MAYLSAPLLAVLVAGEAPAEVKVERATDGGVRVTGTTYTLVIDAKGNVTEVAVGGTAALRHTFGTPGRPAPAAPSVTVTGRTVAVRSGDARVEFACAADRVRVVTEGYGFECQLVAANVTAAVVPGGRGGPLADPAAAYPGATAVVLANGRTVRFGVPFHALPGRLVPTSYCDGTGKPGDRLEFEWKLGDPADAALLLSGIRLAGVGDGYGRLADGGNRGAGMVHFPDPARVVLTAAQDNLGEQPMTVELTLSVADHYLPNSRVVAAEKRTVELAAKAPTTTRWELPRLDPGFYWLSLTETRGGKPLTDAKLTFAVDLTNYDRPPTTPADFAAFWNRQEARLRETPANPVLRRVSPPGGRGTLDEVTLDLPGGRKLAAAYFVPAARKPGDIAVVTASVGAVHAEMLKKAAAGELPAAKAVTLWVRLPDDATFARWDAADDNNFLDSVFAYLRGVDFLTGRPEVDPKRVLTFGASRAGPLSFLAAALRPGNVCGTQAHVHTSAGLSWTDRPYLGWGVPSGYDPAKPDEVRRLAAMAGYFDPVNHAPFVTCPTIFGYGVEDGLSPAPGIELMYRRCGSTWKRISRDAGGHVYSDGFRALEKELADLLGTGVAADPARDRILKDH